MTKQQAIEKIEANLVERYMQRNGWEFPSGNMGCEDYDAAVKDVKWFMSNMEFLGCRLIPPELKVLSDEEIEKIVEESFKKDYLLEHRVATRGHWEDITTIIAQAQRDYDLRQQGEYNRPPRKERE